MTITLWRERRVAEGRVDSMATVLAEDGYTLAPNQPPIVGCAGWLALFRPQLTQGKRRIDNVPKRSWRTGPVP